MKIGDITFVEFGETFFRNVVVAYLVEQVDECGIALSEHLLQFDVGIVAFFKGKAVEEIGRFVEILQDFPVFVSDNGRQLLYVANHKQLHTAERDVRVSDVSQSVVNLVEEVGPDHAYLVDDEEFECSDDVEFLFAYLFHLSVYLVWGEDDGLELEEGVDGHSACIDSGHACGGEYDHPFGKVRLQTLQEGCFSCACFPRKKEVLIGLSNDLVG